MPTISRERNSRPAILKVSPIDFIVDSRAGASGAAILPCLTDLSRDLGLAVNSAKAWLSVLQDSFQVIVLRPFFANVGKRSVGTPKVYFTGLRTLCYLAGLRDPEHASSGPMGGAIFEAAVLMEIGMALVRRGDAPQVYFRRISALQEVDIVIDAGGKLVPIEAKLSATPRPAMGDVIRRFREDLGKKSGAGYLVHPGDVKLPLAPGVTALPFAEL